MVISIYGNIYYHIANTILYTVRGWSVESLWNADGCDDDDHDTDTKEEAELEFPVG